MSPRKAGTLRPSRARKPQAPLDQVAELLTVDPAMNAAPLGFTPDAAPAAPAPDPELAATAALDGPDPAELGLTPASVAPWTGAQLIDAAEAAVGASVAVAADMHKVPTSANAAELERLSTLSRMERQLLGLVAEDAASVLGTRGVMPPKLAAAMFFAGVLWIGFARQRAVLALAPSKRAAAEDEHLQRWGRAADAVPVGTRVQRSGFGAPWGQTSPAA